MRICYGGLFSGHKPFANLLNLKKVFGVHLFQDASPNLQFGFMCLHNASVQMRRVVNGIFKAL